MKNKHVISAVLVTVLWLVITLLLWFGPRQNISEAERRKLEQMPPLTLESVSSGRFMSKFESFTQDQFPMRDGFRRLKALFTYHVLQQKDNHGIYIVEDQAAKLEYPLRENSLVKAKQKFREIYDLYLKENCGNIVFSVVPDKGYYLADKAGAPHMDYDRLFEIMADQDWARYADITDCLTGEDYYSTDSHWRQEKLLPAAKRIANALGTETPRDEDYRVTALDRPFYGVYYGQAALPMEPETMWVMESELLGECTVYNLEDNSVSWVYNMDKRSSRDLYDVFLSGPVSVLTIENPSGDPEKELTVFRDSFGSSMVPLLVNGYSKVTLVDIRYVPVKYLNNFLEFNGQDILFLYSTTVLNNSAVLK